MPIKDILDTLDTVNEDLANELQTIIGRNVPSSPPDIDPNNPASGKAAAVFAAREQKLVNALIRGTAATSQTILTLLAKDQISEAAAERQLKELAAKSELKLKELRTRGDLARAATAAQTSGKLEIQGQAIEGKKEIKEIEAAVKKEIPLINAEAEANKVTAKSQAKINEAEEIPLAAYRAEREILRLKEEKGYQTAQDNYAIHHGRMKHAIKIGAPLPVVPPEALAVMEPGGFKTKLETLRADTIASRQLAWQRDKIKVGLHDPIAVQPIEDLVAQGGSHKKLLPHALKVQGAVTEATGELFKQGIKVAPGGAGASLVNQPLWGGGAKTEAATEGVQKVLSLIGQTGKFDPASVGSVAQAVKAAGKLGGRAKLGIGGAGAYLLYKLLAGGDQAPEMTPQQQLMMAQQMQEQQQKAALVQSLIQQREASSENDMAKAMLLRMQMMQGAGGGGGVL